MAPQPRSNRTAVRVPPGEGRLEVTVLPQGKSDAPHAGNAVNAHRMASEETVLSMNDCARPNGSRLSCGRHVCWRKEAGPLIELDSKATQFFPTCERPAASSAC